MAAVRSKDTRPEMIVRHWLWRRGFRYRLNDPRLPGHPDLVLRKYRTCIFVNGCFWHGHDGCKYFKLPQTNAEFWRKKISRTVWECQLREPQRERTLRSLAFTLNRIFLDDHSKRYEAAEERPQMAAEPLGENG